MTVGIVQKEIRVGMSQTDVVSTLGSPNIVTKDKEGKESWVYDKIATEASYSRSSGSMRGGVGGGSFGGGDALILGGIGGGGLGGVGVLGADSLILGGVRGGYSKDAGAMSVTQKTLTVIIKFDENYSVESFSYHSSKF